MVGLKLNLVNEVTIQQRWLEKGLLGLGSFLSLPLKNDTLWEIVGYRGRAKTARIVILVMLRNLGFCLYFDAHHLRILWTSVTASGRLTPLTYHRNLPLLLLNQFDRVTISRNHASQHNEVAAARLALPMLGPVYNFVWHEDQVRFHIVTAVIFNFKVMIMPGLHYSSLGDRLHN